MITLYNCIRAVTRKQRIPPLSFIEQSPVFRPPIAGYILKPRYFRENILPEELDFEEEALTNLDSSHTSVLELIEELENYRSLYNKEITDEKFTEHTEASKNPFKFSFGAGVPMDTEENNNKGKQGELTQVKKEDLSLQTIPEEDRETKQTDAAE